METEISASKYNSKDIDASASGQDLIVEDMEDDYNTV